MIPKSSNFERMLQNNNIEQPTHTMWPPLDTTSIVKTRFFLVCSFCFWSKEFPALHEH